MSSKDVEKFVKLSPEAEVLMERMFQRSLLSARGYHRVLKVAQTIADLEGLSEISKGNLSEAFNYRLRETTTEPTA